MAVVLSRSRLTLSRRISTYFPHVLAVRLATATNAARSAQCLFCNILFYPCLSQAADITPPLLTHISTHPISCLSHTYPTSHIHRRQQLHCEHSVHTALFHSQTIRMITSDHGPSQDFRADRPSPKLSLTLSFAVATTYAWRWSYQRRYDRRSPDQYC